MDSATALDRPKGSCVAPEHISQGGVVRAADSLAQAALDRTFVAEIWHSLA